MSKIIKVSDITMENFYKNIYNYVIYMDKKITVGQYIFNKVLGSEYTAKFGVEVNPINKKEMSRILSNLDTIYESDHSKIASIVDILKKIAYKVGTLNSPSFTIDDIAIYKKFNEFRKKINKATTVEDKLELQSELKDMIEKYAKDNKLAWSFVMDAGAGANMNQLSQLVGIRGALTDVNNNIKTVVESPIVGGLTPSELFFASAASRKGIADRALNTATTGYLERKLVYAMGSIRFNPEIKDCGTEMTFNIKMNSDIRDRIIGRRIIKDGKVTVVNKNILSTIKNGDIIKLRSPIFCKSNEVCLTCYGSLGLVNETEDVGILAGNTIGERGSQLIMKTFHQGAASGMSTIDIIEELTKNQYEYSYEDYNKLFIQRKNDIILNKPGSIKIKITKVVKSLMSVTDDGDLILPYISGLFNSGGKSYKINIDTCAKISKMTTGFNLTKTELIIDVEDSGVKLFEVMPKVSNISIQIQQLRTILERKNERPDILYIFNRIFEKYKSGSDADTVHFECILAAALRDRKNPFRQARLVQNPYDPVFYSIKDIPYLDNYKMGIQFENISKGIEMGILENEVSKALSEKENIDRPESPLIRI